MVTKLAGGDNEASLEAWTNTIVDEINNGTYKTVIPEWISCTDPSDALVGLPSCSPLVPRPNLIH